MDTIVPLKGMDSQKVLQACRLPVVERRTPHHINMQIRQLVYSDASMRPMVSLKTRSPDDGIESADFPRNVDDAFLEEM